MCIRQRRGLIPVPHLLVIGGASETMVRAFRLGFEVSYFGPCQESETFDTSLLEKCFSVRKVKIDQVAMCLALARELHNASPITAVLSFTELGMETAAIIANAIDVRGLDLWATAVTRYKDQTRLELANHPELALPWKRLNSKDDLYDFYSKNGPAVIIKPVSGMASIGVQKIRSPTELDSFIDQFDLKSINNYMVEKFIEGGCQYSVETLSVEGRHYVISMSQARLSGDPYPLISYHTVPPYRLDNSSRKRIASATRAFLDIARLKNGVAHTEVKLDESGCPRIIESQTRVGGDHIWQMVELTTGVALVDLTLKSFLQPVSAENFPKSSKVAGFFCLLPPEGQVKSVSDTDFLKDCDGIIEYRVSIEPGTMIKPIKNNMERYGFIILQAPDHAELFARINAISRKLWVEYDDRIWHPVFE